MPAQRKEAIRARRYVAEVACEVATVRATQQLRHRVFAGEMGAQLHTRIDGLDYDEFDDYCDHLLVREIETGDIVACTRLLSDTQAANPGRFYSEGEFDLTGVLALPGRFLEIGRTCVDPAHRGSIVLSTLWNGLAEYVYQGRFNYLMGCASITPGPHGFAVDAVYRQIDSQQFGPKELAVKSKNPVPAWKRCQQDESGIPPLLQAYLRLGAQVCGDPYWDEDFNVMDVFILLDLTRLHNRYEKRFIATKAADAHATIQALA
ncbi:MAG: GNAT family N-acetyltransferase [Proteobacteria bacterium]|nr:GNAT family N-acetyltransferase [Pseudomonadota bacterium]